MHVEMRILVQAQAQETIFSIKFPIVSPRGSVGHVLVIVWLTLQKG